MPYAGSFHLYAKKFIGRGTAFTVAVLYWLNWIMALASEFTAAGIIMRHWFPRSPTALWSALFIGLVLGLNILSVRIYGEAEFWFASVKVVTIVIFILVGLAAIVGVLSLHASGVGAGGAGGQYRRRPRYRPDQFHQRRTLPHRNRPRFLHLADRHLRLFRNRSGGRGRRRDQRPRESHPPRHP